MRKANSTGLPPAHGLYRPEFEHDSCGVGFVAHIKGERSHQIIEDADHLLCRMDHRGARGAEPNTGDGAGMVTALPHEFLREGREARASASTLPAPGKFAAGVVFLPTDAAERERCKATVAALCAEEGQTLVGWRVVPTRRRRRRSRRRRARAAPHIEQLFVAAGAGFEGEAFERKLYLIRKRASHRLRGDTTLTQAKQFYVCSLSTQGAHLQGHADAGPALNFYPDLRRPRLHDAPRDGALALLDEHVPELGPRAAESLHVAQRRDQHAARQRELDARAPGRRRKRAVRRST